MERTAVSLAAYWRLISTNANFRRLWLAQIVSEMGDWIYSVTIYALLLEKTGRAESVALAVVLQMLPQVFVAPAAGVLNDRVSRRTVMIASDLLRAAVVLAMLFLSRGGWITPIYALLCVETMLWAFFEPGRSATIPNVTPKDELVVANTLGSVTWSLNLALGAGLGGIVAVLAGREAVFLLNALSFVASAVLLGRMRFTEPHLATAKPLQARDLVDFRPVLEGVRYVRSDGRRVSLLLAKAGLGLMGTHWVLLPIFGERVFPVQAQGMDAVRGGMLGMSVLLSSRGVGALLGPFVAGKWTGQDHRKLRLGVLLGFCCAAAGYLGLSLAPSLLLACCAVILTHSGTSMVWVFTTTLLQFHTEDRFRGRVFSADFAFLISAMAASSYSVGLLVDGGIPVRTLAACTGVLAVLPALLWGSRLRRWSA